MTSDPGLRLVRDGAVAEIVLARPERQNALSRAMWCTLAEHCRTIAGDPTIRVVVVRGEAPSFSAGADIAEFAQVFADETAAHDYNELVQAALSALAGLEQPTVAQITGNCIGGGCGLAVACDLRFAAADARLGITPARIGLAYSLGEIKRLIDLVGAARAKDLLFSARLLATDEALRIGLLDRVVPTAELDATVRDYVAGLLMLSGNSQRLIKRLTRLILDGATGETAESRALRDGAVSHPDFTEGRQAFLEKRRPRFG